MINLVYLWSLGAKKIHMDTCECAWSTPCPFLKEGHQLLVFPGLLETLCYVHVLLHAGRRVTLSTREIHERDIFSVLASRGGVVTLASIMWQHLPLKGLGWTAETCLTSGFCTFTVLFHALLLPFPPFLHSSFPPSNCTHSLSCPSSPAVLCLLFFKLVKAPFYIHLTPTSLILIIILDTKWTTKTRKARGGTQWGTYTQG